MTLQMNSIPFALLRVTYSFLCDILILFNIVNALPCHEHLLSESWSPEFYKNRIYEIACLYYFFLAYASTV